jgi:hypothetical protein
MVGLHQTEQSNRHLKGDKKMMGPMPVLMKNNGWHTAEKERGQKCL